MTLRIIEDWIEFDGVRVAKLLPNATLSLLDLLNEKFEELAEIEDEYRELENSDFGKKIKQTIKKILGSDHRAKTLAQRMAKAKMRVISTEDK